MCRLEARTWVPSPSTWHASTTYHHSCSDQDNQMEVNRSSIFTGNNVADAAERPDLCASDLVDGLSLVYKIS